MFMKEFRIIDAAVSVEKLRLRLKDSELEEYGEAFIPEFVYDVIRQLPRFSSMRVSLAISNSSTLLMQDSVVISRMLKNSWGFCWKKCMMSVANQCVQIPTGPHQRLLHRRTAFLHLHLCRLTLSLLTGMVG